MHFIPGNIRHDPLSFDMTEDAIDSPISRGGTHVVEACDRRI